MILYPRHLKYWGGYIPGVPGAVDAYGGKKSNPLSYILQFLAAAQNFLMQLCYYILCSYRRRMAKYCLIISKYDKVM